MSPASGRSGASGESAGIAERGTSGIKDGAIGSGIAARLSKHGAGSFRRQVVANFGLTGGATSRRDREFTQS